MFVFVFILVLIHMFLFVFVLIRMFIFMFTPFGISSTLLNVNKVKIKKVFYAKGFKKQNLR